MGDEMAYGDSESNFQRPKRIRRYVGSNRTVSLKIVFARNGISNGGTCQTSVD